MASWTTDQDIENIQGILFAEELVPDVTVLISSYNGAKTIGETIDSAFANKGITIEVLVGDDASTDNTAEVAEEHGAIVKKYRKNSEKAATLNKLWKHATGRYVIVIDDDDTFEPGGLTFLVQEFDRLIKITENTRYFLYGQTQYHGERDTLHRPPAFSRDRFYKHNPVCSLVLVHRETILADKIKYIEDERHHSEDWAYMLNMIKAGYKGYPVDVLVLHYNFYEHDRQSRQAANDYAVMREYFGKRFDPL